MESVSRPLNAVGDGTNSWLKKTAPSWWKGAREDEYRKMETMVKESLKDVMNR